MLSFPMRLSKDFGSVLTVAVIFSRGLRWLRVCRLRFRAEGRRPCYGVCESLASRFVWASKSYG